MAGVRLIVEVLGHDVDDALAMLDEAQRRLRKARTAFVAGPRAGSPRPNATSVGEIATGEALQTCIGSFRIVNGDDPELLASFAQALAETARGS